MELISFSINENKTQTKPLTKFSQSTSEEATKWQSKHQKRTSYSNISILTTKYDDVQEKINSSENKKQKSNQEEDSILETLKNRGLLDCSTEKKINEYNESLKGKDTKLTRKNSFSYKISLLQEYRIIQKNITICDTQLENLEYMNQMKIKKIEILENARKVVNCKIEGNKVTGKNVNIAFKNNNTSNKNEINIIDLNVADRCEGNKFENNNNYDGIDNNYNKFKFNYESYLVNSIKNVKLNEKENFKASAAPSESKNDNLEAEKLKKVIYI